MFFHFVSLSFRLYHSLLYDRAREAITEKEKKGN